MSKVALLLFGGTGLSATSVGGFYLLNKYGVFSWVSKITISSEIPANSWDEFRAGGKESDCVNQYFSGLNLGGEHERISTSNPVDANYFSSEESSQNFRSCLIINWERKGPDNTAGDKWNGKFKWVWSFVTGKKGFVMFTLVKPSSTVATLDVEGGVYVLEEKEDNWTVKGYKELDGTKKINEDNFEDVFPKATDALGRKDKTFKPYWDFIRDKTELKTICKYGDGEQCLVGSRIGRKFDKRSWIWEKNGEVNEKWVKWSENIDKWMVQLYPKSELDLLGALGPSLDKLTEFD